MPMLEPQPIKYEPTPEYARARLRVGRSGCHDQTQEEGEERSLRMRLRSVCPKPTCLHDRFSGRDERSRRAEPRLTRLSSFFISP
jgi:hypothetical protein